MTESSWIIREELPADCDSITSVTAQAFLNHPHSDNTEQFIIEELRRNRALSLSLVAEIEGRVIGHVAFSEVTISDGSSNWYGLGPLSVEPAFQKRGVGQSLVRAGLEILKTQKDIDPMIPVLIMTAFGTIEEAVQAMKEGAFDFVRTRLLHIRTFLQSTS